MSIRTCFIISAFAYSTLMNAQGLDHYDIMLVQTTMGDSVEINAAPRLMTSFNRTGYNNQPSFFSNTELYLTAQLYGDTTQTDIVALHLGDQTLSRVTNTPLTAEYSPTLMPDGRRFSAVRVEENGEQYLWSFPIDQSDGGQRVFENTKGVGYHCWLKDTLVALFIVGEQDQPHTLQVAGVKTQKMIRISSNIGRCLLKTSDGKLAFVQKATEQTWYLKTWSHLNNTSEIVVKMPAGVEDFAILSNNTYLCGQGAVLWQYKPGYSKDWSKVSDLSKYGIQKITRIAASKDGKLAIVVQ